MLKKISFVTLLIFSYCLNGKFLLIMGPSGVGKSTIIHHLKALDSRFIYVTPLTTRELRPGERDKLHVNLEEINRLDTAGGLLAINTFYGVYYATPKYIVDNALAQQKFPVLDWPVEKISVLEEKYAGQIYKVYIEPDSVQELKRRLSLDDRDKNGKRYAAGVQEMRKLAQGQYDQSIDLKLINKVGFSEKTARAIFSNFLKFLDS